MARTTKRFSRAATMNQVRRLIRCCRPQTGKKPTHTAARQRQTKQPSTKHNGECQRGKSTLTKCPHTEPIRERTTGKPHQSPNNMHVHRGSEREQQKERLPGWPATDRSKKQAHPRCRCCLGTPQEAAAQASRRQNQFVCAPH